VIEIDGSDGGGQLVRSSLSLAALSGRSVRIEGIRGARSEPGLKAQHLAAVEAVATACEATVDGAERGSETLTFESGAVAGGTLAVDVGTAGSATLVADALLPLAAGLDEPLAATIHGGTDVKWSPPLDAHRLGKLPLLRRHGWGVALECRRRGFYPEGGGEVALHLFPSDPDPLALPGSGGREQTETEHLVVHSVETDDLADGDVAVRQADAATEALAAAGYEVDDRMVETVAGRPSTGSVIVVRAACERGILVGDALGEPGRPAEDVGRSAAASLRAALGVDPPDARGSATRAAGGRGRRATRPGADRTRRDQPGAPPGVRVRAGRQRRRARDRRLRVRRRQSTPVVVR